MKLAADSAAVTHFVGSWSFLSLSYRPIHRLKSELLKHALSGALNFGEYAMISKEQCMDLILSSVPEFGQAWEGHKDYWKGEEAGLCNDVAAFSDYVAEQINHGERDNLKTIFDLIEEMITEGDQDVQDVVATCFLENLINLASANKLYSPDFVPFLGPNSREYCKAWDRFTGVKTEGL